MKILKTLLITGLATTMATTAIADTTLVFDGKKGKTAMKMQFSGNVMRATSVSDNSSYMIYDANNTTFTSVSTKDKEYFVMDKEMIAKLSDLGAMMDDLISKQLGDMPEAQREMMRGMTEKMVKSQMPKEAPKAEYSFTGKSASYNGFDCQVVMKKSGRKKSEFCVTEYSKVGMSANEFSVITSFQSTIEAMAQKFAQDNSMDISSLGDYIPVKYKQAGEKGTLSKVNHDSLDSSLFVVPADYSEIKMPF